MITTAYVRFKAGEDVSYADLVEGRNEARRLAKECVGQLYSRILMGEYEVLNDEIIRRNRRKRIKI